MSRAYDYIPITKAIHGQYFQFITGVAVNQVVLKERNLLIYKNIITGKISRVKGFVDVDKETRTCRLKYLKNLDHTFNSLYQTRRDIELAPF